jgi:hypothetical protein
LEVSAKYDTKRGSIDDVNGLFECDKYGVSALSFRCLPRNFTILTGYADIIEVAEVSELLLPAFLWDAHSERVGGSVRRPGPGPMLPITSYTRNSTRTSRC